MSCSSSLLRLTVKFLHVWPLYWSSCARLAETHTHTPQTWLSSGEPVRKSSRPIARPDFFSDNLSISIPKRTTPKRKRETSLAKDHQFAVSMVERSAERQVKVHYEGYSSQYDEWKDEDEVVPMPNPDSMPLRHHCECHCHNELAPRIKLSLNCVRKQSVIVHFDMADPVSWWLESSWVFHLMPL